MSKKARRKAKRRVFNSPCWMVAGSVGKGSKEDYEVWRHRGFYSGAAASECKRINPETGEITVVNVLEEAANDLLKTDKALTRQQSRTRKKCKPAPRSSNHIPSAAEKEAFYKSWEWRRLRMQVIKLQGRSCRCCGARPDDRDMAGKPVKIVVDHIKPLSKFWGLRLKRDNLQVLCDECNQGKGAWDQTDHRKPTAQDEFQDAREAAE